MRLEEIKIKAEANRASENPQPLGIEAYRLVHERLEELDDQEMAGGLLDSERAERRELSELIPFLN